jgi:transposase
MKKKPQPHPSIQATDSELTMLNEKVAGIDIGNEAHYVSVSPRLCADPVRRFGTFTADLEAMADWLVSLGIESVAMESTGIYWLNAFEVLEARGIAVLLVNARYPKNVSGRKSDVSDSRWLQQLHSYGLLPASFIPESAIRELRAYVRQRGSLVVQKAQVLQRIGKALQLMNIKIQNKIARLDSKVGMQIVRAIAEGEQKVEVLAKFHTERMKVSQADFQAALQGNYRSEHLFVLKQALAAFDFFKAQILECEQAIEQILQKWQTGEEVKPEDFVSQAKTTQVRQNDYRFEVEGYLQAITSVDLLAIKGLSESNLLTILSETGLDMSRWESAKHFTSWLGLSPKPKKSGDKVIGHIRQKHPSRANQAFKLAAWALHSSKCHLGALYRKLSIRKNTGVAVQAVARKLAVIFYTMLKNKTDYQNNSADEYEKKEQERRQKRLEKEAKKLGFSLQKVNS